VRLIPYHKSAIESKLTPDELCQKLALFVEHKDLEEVYLRDFLSLGILDLLIYDQKKRFIGEYDEKSIHIRTSSAYGNIGGFNLNYLVAAIEPTENGKTIINYEIRAPKRYYIFLIAIGIITTLLNIALPFFNFTNPSPPLVAPAFVFVVYISTLRQFSYGVDHYEEKLFPHIKANSIQDIISRRKETIRKRKARRKR
jgi:hypothetical protein